MTDPEYRPQEPIRVAGINVIELVGGLALVAVGLGAAYMALDFGLGTRRNVGPGMLPMLLGVVLAIVGLAVIVEGRTSTAQLPYVAWRPIIAICAGLAAFGFLVERAGAVAALVALIGLTALAETTLRLKTTILITLALLVVTAGLSWAFYGAMTLDLLPRSR